jgi:hypothetical protein
MPAERIQKYIDRLHTSRAHLNEVLDSVPAEQWDQQIYSDGAQWTVRQLLIHLMAADKGQNNVVMGIADGREVIPADYDLERFNKRSVEKQAEITVEQARTSLAASRQQLLEWLAQVDESALDKQGRHASMHILSVAQILNVIANHEATHADDIAKFLQG